VASGGRHHDQLDVSAGTAGEANHAGQITVDESHRAIAASALLPLYRCGRLVCDVEEDGIYPQNVCDLPRHSHQEGKRQSGEVGCHSIF